MDNQKIWSVIQSESKGPRMGAPVSEGRRDGCLNKQRKRICPSRLFVLFRSSMCNPAGPDESFLGTGLPLHPSFSSSLKYLDNSI